MEGAYARKLNIGAELMTNTILGVPYVDYSIYIYTPRNPMLIKIGIAPMLQDLQGFCLRRSIAGPLVAGVQGTDLLV